MHEQARYPHLLPQDAPILTAYLKEHGHQYRTVIFDYRVGEGRDPGPAYEANIRQMGLDLSRRRIDALGITPTAYHVIEVTDSAGVTALGQLIAYKHLLAKTLPTPTEIVCLLIARDTQTDMLPAYTAAGIKIHLYPES